MATALLDSNVLIAARVTSDLNHEEGAAIVAGIESDEFPVGRVPDVALAEVLNYVHTRTRHELAIETLDSLQASVDIEIDQTARSDHDAGRSLFRRYEGLSYTDAVLVAYMRRTGMDYLYSFDDDFDAVDDVTRLASATNPFS